MGKGEIAMICYLCNETIPEEDPHYNDQGHQVCKPCFKEAPRCFVCRFPGKKLETVEGLGLECEFCRGNLIQEGVDINAFFPPMAAFLKNFSHKMPENPVFNWVPRLTLRELQTDADLPPEDFIDDFLRYSYPIYYKGGAFHSLFRMPKSTFLVYAIGQMAVWDIASRFDVPDLSGKNPFATMARGWCHWVAYTAAERLGYDLEKRQLKKWPELGLQGEFERWVRMSQHQPPQKMVGFLRANLTQLAKKYL